MRRLSFGESAAFAGHCGHLTQGVTNSDFPGNVWYWQELEANVFVGQLVADVGDAQITLLYTTRDTDCNHAVVLRDFLRER